MDGDQEQRHCCKVCGKSFPSGRSLGGHMRSHLPLNSSAEAEERPKSSRSFAPVAAGYGLRENPRRTWRLSDSNAANSSIRDKLCRECGKRFPSRQSLFRHMRRHSTRPCEALEDEEEEEEEEEEKAQGLEEQQGSWSLGGDKLCFESQSDTEANAAAVPKRMRRSRRLVAIPDSSSSVSEYEKEQEDVALSLMMLSRDVGLRGSNALAITESSDKNSVVLEDKGIAQESNAKKKGLEPGDLGQGRPRNGLKRVDSDASDNGYIFKDEFKKHKVDFNAGKLEDSSTKKHLSSVDELERNESFDELDQEVGKCNPANFFASQRLGFNSSEKRSRYECTTCSKVFHSYQALGGHRASHKRTNGCLPRRINGSELSMETNGSSDPALMEEMGNQNVGIEAGYGSVGRFKGHECPICRKVFPSGQALGGHKRSHLLASSAASHDTIVVKQRTPVMPELLDLNLPAPVNEGSNDTNVNAELKPLWIATEFRSDPVLGLNSK